MTTIRFFDRELTCPKEYTDGTHRARSPADTFADYSRHMRRMGITRVANITGLDVIGLPVYTSIRPRSRSLSTSQGKGFDADSAKTSALMESVEGWHAEQGDLPVRWDTYGALADASGGRVVDLEALPRMHIGAPDQDVPRLWMEGWDLLSSEPCWVPYESVCTNFVGGRNDRVTFLPTSNGLASGNHLLEAIVHAISEVIERDADTLWRLGAAPELVDLAAVRDPLSTKVLDLLRQADIEVAAWDMTSDTGIPAYGSCVFERPDSVRWRSLGVHYGFGCHLSPSIALLRALTEVVQSRVTHVAGSRDDMFRHEYMWMHDQSFIDGLWNDIRSAESCQSLDDRADLAGSSFEDDVETLLAALRRVGIRRAVVVDLTRDDLGIPVVKAIIPGLEGPYGTSGVGGERAARRLEEVAS